MGAECVRSAVLPAAIVQLGVQSGGWRSEGHSWHVRPCCQVRGRPVEARRAEDGRPGGGDLRGLSPSRPLHAPKVFGPGRCSAGSSTPWRQPDRNAVNGASTSGRRRRRRTGRGAKHPRCNGSPRWKAWRIGTGNVSLTCVSSPTPLCRCVLNPTPPRRVLRGAVARPRHTGLTGLTPQRQGQCPHVRFASGALLHHPRRIRRAGRSVRGVGVATDRVVRVVGNPCLRRMRVVPRLMHRRRRRRRRVPLCSQLSRRVTGSLSAE